MASPLAPREALEATAIAHPNIALVKYWGKRDHELNLPATGSISLTLSGLATTTYVRFSADLPGDSLFLGASTKDGRPETAETAQAPQPGTTQAPPATAGQLRKVSALLDLLRAEAGTAMSARVESSNNFPTGAGLASSASGFAALVTAANAALGLDMPTDRLSELARRGSGSAARSMIGGFAELHLGERSDGADCVATQLIPETEWPLTVVVAITTRQAKATSSSIGMEQSRATSPYYDAWVSSAPVDLEQARNAIAAKDFQSLAGVSEHSCLKMHALMLSTKPALLYWTPASVACLHAVRELRETHAVATFFTMDAGPQVKAVCEPQDADRVAAALAEIPGVVEVRTVGLGPGAAVIPGPGRLLKIGRQIGSSRNPPAETPAEQNLAGDFQYFPDGESTGGALP